MRGAATSDASHAVYFNAYLDVTKAAGFKWSTRYNNALERDPKAIAARLRAALAARQVRP